MISSTLLVISEQLLKPAVPILLVLRSIIYFGLNKVVRYKARYTLSQVLFEFPSLEASQTFA